MAAMKHPWRIMQWLSLCCFTVFIASADALAADEPPLDDPAEVKKLLATPMLAVEKSKLSPQGAVRFLGEMADANVYCNTAALRGAGYITDTEADKKLSINLTNATLTEAMNGLVKSMNKPAAPLKWDVENGVIVLSTAADKTWKLLAQADRASANDDAFKDDRVINEVKFDDLLLSEAVKRLREEGINLHFRWPVLQPVGIDPPTRVSLSLKRVRPRTVVQLLVRDLAGPDGKVSFFVRDSVWVISTPADLARQTREWDLRPQQVKDQPSANKLATVVEDVTFDGTTFGDVLENISRASELAFDVDWTGLSAAGVDRSTPISINVHHVRASTAIDLLLSEAGGADHVLDYIAENGTVRVTVKKDLKLVDQPATPMNKVTKPKK